MVRKPSCQSTKLSADAWCYVAVRKGNMNLIRRHGVFCLCQTNLDN